MDADARQAAARAAAAALAARERYEARRAAREVGHADEELEALVVYERAFEERDGAAGPEAMRRPGLRDALSAPGLLDRFASSLNRFW
jgi:hypothetical protein